MRFGAAGIPAKWAPAAHGAPSASPPAFRGHEFYSEPPEYPMSVMECSAEPRSSGVGWDLSGAHPMPYTTCTAAASGYRTFRQP